MATSPPPTLTYKPLDEFRLSDLEAVRLLLRGGSVIDWHRLNFETEEDVRLFLRAQEYDHEDPADRARAEAVKGSAISYLRRNFDFPIPKPVATADVLELVALASGRGHRQLCACTILKVMHIIHHLEARELLFMLPVSDQEVFHLVEQKVYRVIGGMLARSLPILEFIGGRKNKDSLYTKLLSKRETVAAQIYDKLRFRIVTREPNDIFPVLRYLMHEIFPFNYVIPNESTNTLFHFRTYCEAHSNLQPMIDRLQLSPDLEDDEIWIDNRFTDPSYRVVHFVVDMPVRLPREMLETAPPQGWALGRVIFVQTEFQIIDRETEQANEMGAASHAHYKQRQKLAVMRRLKVGMEGARRGGRPTTERTPKPARPPRPIERASTEPPPRARTEPPRERARVEPPKPAEKPRPAPKPKAAPKPRAATPKVKSYDRERNAVDSAHAARLRPSPKRPRRPTRQPARGRKKR